MATTLLRKLTERSVLHFGRWSESSVGHLMGMNMSTYLRWIYYNCDMITFTDEILEKLNIRGEDRIQKPGKNPEAHIELNNKMYAHMDCKRRSHMSKIARGRIMQDVIGRSKWDSRRYSKGSMQARNHGR